ncbi:hypothetical protein LSH36_37g16006, partial [Paralvinella palmiformis]
KHIFYLLQDEFLDVIYWMRQLVGIVVGVLWGVLPIKGILGIILFFALNTAIVYLYFSSYQKIDEDDYGGLSEILKEGLMTSFATFLASTLHSYATRLNADHQGHPVHILAFANNPQCNHADRPGTTGLRNGKVPIGSQMSSDSSCVWGCDLTPTAVSAVKHLLPSPFGSCVQLPSSAHCNGHVHTVKLADAS